MANVQHIFSGNGDPNTLQITAPAGSHYSDLDTDCEYIASASGKWHLIAPILVVEDPDALPLPPAGGIFISPHDPDLSTILGISDGADWLQLTTILYEGLVTTSTPVRSQMVISTSDNKLYIAVDGSWKGVSLTDLD